MYIHEKEAGSGLEYASVFSPLGVYEASSSATNTGKDYYTIIEDLAAAKGKTVPQVFPIIFIY